MTNETDINITNVATAIKNKITSLIGTHNSDSTAHSNIRNSIPSKTSDLTNDSGFLTSHQDITGKVDKSNGANQMTDSSAYSNIGTSANSTQKTINNAIDTEISSINNSITNYCYDTGWKSLTLASGFSTYDSGHPTRYRRIGKTVHIEGIFKNSSALASGSETTMATISDTTCRPPHDQFHLMQGTGKNFFLLRVNTDGTITISRYGTTANAQCTSGSWLHCYITYFVD